MKPEHPETILNHPALGGRVLHVWRESGWERWRIQTDGDLRLESRSGEPRPQSWRTPTAA